MLGKFCTRRTAMLDTTEARLVDGHSARQNAPTHNNETGRCEFNWTLCIRRARERGSHLRRWRPTRSHSTRMRALSRRGKRRISPATRRPRNAWLRWRKWTTSTIDRETTARSSQARHCRRHPVHAERRDARNLPVHRQERNSMVRADEHRTAVECRSPAPEQLHPCRKALLRARAGMRQRWKREPDQHVRCGRKFRPRSLNTSHRPGGFARKGSFTPTMIRIAFGGTWGYEPPACLE